MRFGERLAVNIVPLWLRLALAIVFIYHGYGKVFTESTYPAEQASRLTALGVSPSAFTSGNAAAGNGAERLEPRSNNRDSQNPTDRDAEAGDTNTPPADTQAEPAAPANRSADDTGENTGEPTLIDPDDPPAASRGTGTNRLASPPVAIDTNNDGRPDTVAHDVNADGTISDEEVMHAVQQARAATRQNVSYNAASQDDSVTVLDDTEVPAVEIDPDAPEPTAFASDQTARGLYGVALVVDRSADTTRGTADTEDDFRFPLIPGMLGQAPYPVYLAWAVGLIELISGVLILVGFLTRLNALLLVGIMAGALWMTSFGPAIASGNAVWGFLPQPALDNPFAPGAYATLLYQITCFFLALALLFAGAGTLSLDRLLFGGRGHRHHHDDDDFD